jgi:peptide deformylase
MWPVRPLLGIAVLALGCATSGTTRHPGNAMDSTPITQTGAPVLRERAKDVTPEQLSSPEFKALVARMVEAMRAAPGVGLAAPQLGASMRVLVMEDRQDLQDSLTKEELAERERVPVPLRVIVNPTLTPIGEEKVTFFEGCLSVSGFAALVERFRAVEVSGLDENGQPVVWRVRGWPARILQHEVDHLNGTLYIDRMITRSFGRLPQVKALYGGRRIDEVKASFGVR